MPCVALSRASRKAVHRSGVSVIERGRVWPLLMNAAIMEHVSARVVGAGGEIGLGSGTVVRKTRVEDGGVRSRCSGVCGLFSANDVSVSTPCETRGEEVVDEVADDAGEDSADLTNVVFGAGRETGGSGVDVIAEEGSRGLDEAPRVLMSGLQEVGLAQLSWP